MHPAQALASAATTNKGQRTANRILDAAELLFARHGFEATSLRDIAALADIQQPGLYKHFASKDELYRSVYERALKPMADLMDSILDGPDDSFRDLTDRMTDLLALHPNIARLLVRAAISPESHRDDVALAWLGRLVDYGRKLTAKAEAMSDDGLIAVQIVAIFNVLFGYFWAAPLIENLTGRPPVDPGLMSHQKTVLWHIVESLAEARVASEPAPC